MPRLLTGFLTLAAVLAWGVRTPAQERGSSPPSGDWLETHQSRTYGKLYVRPIAVGEFPPVLVTRHAAGPEVETRPKAMRDPDRPSIVVFCKQIDPALSRLLAALDSCAAFAGTPLLVTVTAEKGIAEADSVHYLRRAEAEQAAAELSGQVERAGLANATVGIAVNRFWRDAIGYEGDDDCLVAYVRERVLFVESFGSAELTAADIHRLVAQLGVIHRGSSTELPAEE